MLRASALTVALLFMLPCAHATEDTKSAVVQQLYNDYAWETGAFQPHRTTFINEERAVLERYLTPSLAALFARDQACSARMHEDCGIGFSPIWDSQDPEGTLFKVSPVPVGNTVTVIVTFPGSKPHAVNYDLKKVGDVWRIDNIRTAKFSLRKIMSHKEW
jgi:hypothetical protein